MQLESAAVLVVGGSSGLGAACVERFATSGARVMVADLRPPESERAEVGFRETDVRDPDAVKAVVEAVRESGDLRCVVICAGVIHGERILGRETIADLEAFRRVVDINLVGTFNVLRLSANAMRTNTPDADGGRGLIVMTASVAALEGQIGQAAYASSKGGVAALTLPAARELGRYGIRVLTIAPGVFETPMMSQTPDKVRDSLLGQTIFPERFGKPEEFADLVLHACQNSMLNGSVLRLDGAMRMTSK